jgi:hypothetical protein
MELEERKEEKIKELTRTIIDAIKPHFNCNVEEIATSIINSFSDVRPPEMVFEMELVTIRQIGMGGGSSIKPGNIIFNWRKLLIEGAESILTIMGAASIPWMIPLAGLVVWNRVYSLLKIEINERHAAVLWVMWQNKDENRYVDQENILEWVNQSLESYNRILMDEEELKIILKELEEMEIIEKSGEKWWLREWVEVTYK